MSLDKKDPTTFGPVPSDVSLLGERRARTAGTICRRAEASVFGGSEPAGRGLGLGGGAPAAAAAL
eukprot:CAMPEP_0197713980 /NCGR_PEP_ID=MMETSP1338-20131121/130731_1 /TAXON_ID=43686 ORGANISM="Pelagodinium beii, Strain RCC1491" /NCGR_SAMPLE_ID=MMETSP1338 /ASSEMBLY_ACC=CAM_ASM_000754 /LENGTH=64 /DNA_ID=CAMNT_0043297921 /DNA_START=683 /DNA_END=877 /DNA_ORIENTATION=+